MRYSYGEFHFHHCEKTGHSAEEYRSDDHTLPTEWLREGGTADNRGG